MLADALSLAAEEEPALLVDMATLTGAARVALGPDMVPVYTRDDGLAADLARHAGAGRRPGVADAALAALSVDARFEDRRHQQCRLGALRRLDHGGAVPVPLRAGRNSRWLHADIYAWNPKEAPGRPEGGEAQAIRALYALFEERYRRLKIGCGPRLK